MSGDDYYLVCDDFYAYMEAQEKVDKCYSDQDNWCKKCINSITKMGFFSSDRSINDYAKNIWGVEPIEVPNPSLSKEGHYVSNQNLSALDKSQ